MEKEKLNKKQRYALDTMLSGSNVFLTGDAGTGKTTVIQTFIDEAEKMLKLIGLIILFSENWIKRPKKCFMQQLTEN